MIALAGWSAVNSIMGRLDKFCFVYSEAEFPCTDEIIRRIGRRETVMEEHGYGFTPGISVIGLVGSMPSTIP